MKRYLIDRNGEAASAFDDRLAEKLGYPMPDFDLASYAVRNLGALDIDIRATEAIVRFRRPPVTRAALHTMARLIESFAISSITVQYTADTLSEKTFSNISEAIAWIEASPNAGGGFAERNMVTVPQRLEALSNRRLSRIEDPEDRLALMFKKWRIANGLFTTEATSFLVRFGLLDRTSVVSKSPTSGELIIEHAAPGFKTYDNYDRSWSFLAHGKPVADQPDAKFGRWIDGTYRDVLDRAAPRFEHVDAVIQAQGAEPCRFRYSRLLLPWRSPEGMHLITGTSYNEFSGPVMQQ